MSDVLILTEDQLRARIALDDTAIDVVEAAFATLARGGVQMPPILSMHMPERNAEVDVKTAYVPGLSGFAVKISPGFFDNPARGLPSTSGLMVVLSSETGRVRAVLLDNGYLTDVRTAAAGGVAARHLSRPEQHPRRDLRRRAAGADAAQGAAAGAPDLAGSDLGPRSRPRAGAGRRSGRARLAGPGRTRPRARRRMRRYHRHHDARDRPILRAEWLRPGQHVTAMGSDQPGKNELDPHCLSRADLYVADRLARRGMIGELRAALAAGLAPDEAPPELGQIVIGTHPGRTAPDQITIADLTGTGVQDTAIATHALAAFSDEA